LRAPQGQVSEIFGAPPTPPEGGADNDLDRPAIQPYTGDDEAHALAAFRLSTCQRAWLISTPPIDPMFAAEITANVAGHFRYRRRELISPRSGEGESYRPTRRCQRVWTKNSVQRPRSLNRAQQIPAQAGRR
jgi:hypothetical protein